MKKAKLVFISLFAHSLFDSRSSVIFGGSVVQLYNIATFMKQSSDVEVSFIVGDYSKNFYKKTYDDISVYNLFNLKKTSLFFKLFQGLKLLLFLVKLSPDTCVMRAASPEVSIVGLYCKIFRKKFVYMTAHEVDCTGEYRKNNPILGLLYEIGVKLANIVITQNEKQKIDIESNLGIKSTILKSGYVIPECHRNNAIDILWVARLDKWKQAEVFLDLVKYFPNNSFVMIAPLSYDKKYANKIEISAKQNKNLKFIQGVPFGEIDSYFCQAKIFVNTSSYEGFPNTFVQAAMYGVPILSLSVNPDNLIDKNRIGIFAENNVQKLIEGCKRLLEDDQFYNIASSNAYRYAKNNHDILIIGKQCEVLLK